MATAELPGIARSTVTTDLGEKLVCCFIPRSNSTDKDDDPVLVLLHGYPQSINIWRHVIPLLTPHISLFIPGLPGYGLSPALPSGSSKRTVASSILRAFEAHLPNRPNIILAGHDRGARISHLIAVDTNNLLKPLGLTLMGLILLDIVPTTVGYEAHADPARARGGFHWSFLANVDLATRMITAMGPNGQGGVVWAQMLHDRWRGTNEQGIQSLISDGAVEIYAGYYENESVIRATCEDYAGAVEEVKTQKQEQEQGKKVAVEVLVLYSDDYLGRNFDVQETWEQWVVSNDKLHIKGIGNGVGHYLAEEAPEFVAKEMIEFLKKSLDVI